MIALFLLLLCTLTYPQLLPGQRWEVNAGLLFDQLSINQSNAQPIGLPPSEQPIDMVTVSFSPQGSAAMLAATGRRVKGVTLYDVIVCSTGPISVPVGEIYQLAASQGISGLDPQIATALVNQVVGLDWHNLVPEIITDGAAGVALLGAGGAVAMSKPILSGLIAGFGVSNIFAKTLQSTGPNPSPVLTQLLSPSALMNFSDISCQSGTLIATIQPKKAHAFRGAIYGKRKN